MKREGEITQEIVIQRLVMAVQAEMGTIGVTTQDWFVPLDVGYGLIDGAGVMNLQQQQQQEQRQQWFNDDMQRNLKRRFAAVDNSFMVPAKIYPSTATTTTTTSSSNHHRNMNNVTAINNNYGGNMLSVAAAQIQKHDHDLESYINLMNQRLRWALQEQTKKQLGSLLQKLEAKASFLLTQKDEEIVQANKRAMELENLVRKLEAENQVWKTVAMENESMIRALNTAIEQLQDKAVANCSPINNNITDDAESCCSAVEDKSIKNRAEDSKGSGVMCQRCNSRDSSLLFLPCRHLCSCVDCEPLLDTCPICKSSKQASIEILFS